MQLKKWLKYTIPIAAVIILSILLVDKYVYNKQETEDGIVEAAIDTEPEKKEEDTSSKLDPSAQRLLDITSGEEEEEDNVELEEGEILTTPTKDYELKQSGWIPSWAYADGLATLNTYAEDFHTVMPVWYGVDAEGNLVDRRPANTSGIVSTTTAYGIDMLPSIAMFDADLMHEILSGTSLDNHINQIVNEVVAENYDGIDLDYENTYLVDAEEYEVFLQNLSTQLHSKGKKLSVTVLAQWGDYVNYTGLQETRKVQDWQMINKYANQVRIMSYDYTTSASSGPGPIAPISWQRDVLEYAVQKITPSKIWLGVHLYGYEWADGKYNVSSVYIGVSKLTANATVNEYNEILKEGYAQYPCGSATCKLYYQTQQGVADRQTLAKEFGIAGVAYWRLGDDGDILGN